MPYLLVGSEPPRDYEAFMIESLEAMRKHGVKGIALVALTTEEDVACLSAYWGMEVTDKVMAAEHIRFDALDAFIYANMDRYLGVKGEGDGAE